MEAARARLGEFRWNATADTWLWSVEMFRVHGYEPGQVEPTTQLVLEHKAPEAISAAEAILDRSQMIDQAFSNYHQIIDANGETRVVVSVGRSRLDRPTGSSRRVRTVFGFMADVTAPHRAARTEAVLAARRSQAALQQALGALITLGGLTEDRAMALIEQHCVPRNVRFGDFAQRFMDLAQQGVLFRSSDNSSDIDRLIDEADPADDVLSAILAVRRIAITQL